MQTLMSVIFIAALFYVIYRMCSYTAPDEEPNEYDKELSDRIERINYINSQIIAVQELITDIELSGGDNLKNISLEWQTAAGRNLNVDMWLDGQSEVTQQMKILAGERLSELTTSLFSEIEKLPLRHRKNAEKTFEECRKNDRKNVE